MNKEQLKEVLESHAKWLAGTGGSWADLSGANLSLAHLFEADLSGANLSRADLFEADLSGANLSRANLSGADLSEANLFRANLFRANLSGANLSGADLSGANLSRANLSGVNLSGANLSGAKWGAKTIKALVACVQRVNDPYTFFAWRMDDGDYVKAGCRFLTVEAYRRHIDASYGSFSLKGIETNQILDFFQERFKATNKPWRDA